ncbi:MAG: hypothetical protein R3330_13675 [Saprospiraceae bacterium]|nr:hypothetical protein [Saprospiraceae bacterium]
MSASQEVTGHIVDHHVIIDIPERHRHYWSPQLNFRIESDEEDHDSCVMKGMIGPRPAVWTLFMFIYFSIGAAGFFISAFGFSRWMLGEFSYLVLALPLAVLFMLTAYRAGKIGERLGAEQIELLKEFVRHAIGNEI